MKIPEFFFQCSFNISLLMGILVAQQNTSNHTGRISTRWKGHGIWLTLHEEIGKMQIHFFLVFNMYSQLLLLKMVTKWVRIEFHKVNAANNFQEWALVERNLTNCLQERQFRRNLFRHFLFFGNFKINFLFLLQSQAAKE